MPNTSYEATIEAGSRIHAALAVALKPFPPLGTSFGIAWFARAEKEFPAMLQAADGLMYAAKRRGKGNFLSRRFAECGDAAQTE